MKKVRWGVIGAGGIADRRTIPGMKKAENAELISVMEINQEFAERLKLKWNAKRAYDNEIDLLNDPEIDAVYISSPVISHAQQAIAAADRGKHILIEKPIALTAKEAEKIVKYCDQKGIMIAAGFMMRFGSYVQEMKKAIAAGKIGKVVSGYGQFTCWYPDMEGNWRQQKKTSGGGALMDMGVHCIDLMQYVTGSKVCRVAAFNDTLTFNYEVEDSSTLILQLENGAQCIVQSNFNIPDQASKWRLEFFGDEGRLVGNNVIGQVDGGNLDALFCGKSGAYDPIQNTQEIEGEEIKVEFGDLYTREIISFGDSVLNGKPLEAPASEAVYIQKIIEAAYISNEQNKIINIDE
ncbi:MAG TPA: Gfo/Idh/MocA family oxidoreductase [Clostridiaceae bacterium]|nr:Gfo/Idh/MocA family oxidoreductase [Clostridiaceae bacterium]